ncbi:MAG: NUDIX hydrolase [Chloroflexota bacterium]
MAGNPVFKRKVYAYVTHRGRLLVFRHVHEPGAGLQVPGGTVEDGEGFEAAVRREAFEETGLPGLELVRFLGEEVRDWSEIGIPAVHYRKFFHLRCTQTPPETWRHTETLTSDGSGPHLFEFFWADLPDGVPELLTGHGIFLTELLQGDDNAWRD